MQEMVKCNQRDTKREGRGTRHVLILAVGNARLLGWYAVSGSI